MTITQLMKPENRLKHMQEDIEEIKERLDELVELLSEDKDLELTDYARAELEKSRATPLSEYISHEDLKKKILG